VKVIKHVPETLQSCFASGCDVDNDNISRRAIAEAAEILVGLLLVNPAGNAEILL
jgi:hypothetical protein